MTDSSDSAGMLRPRAYLELRRAEIGWRYQVLLGITEVRSGWRPTKRWARGAGRRARRPFLDEVPPPSDASARTPSTDGET